MYTTTPANLRIGLLLLCLACAGCVRFSTPAERNASFAPYDDAKIGQERVKDYLIYRSGILLGAERVDIVTNSPDNRFHHTGGTGYATAAAIDPRGYFLTASHCLDKKECWLVFLRDGKIQAERPRIVWRGDEKRGEPDLAILSVSRPLTHTFPWATQFTNGSPVVVAGLRIKEGSHDVTAQCMAGSVLEVSPLSTNSWSYSVVSHSSPLRRGDSGGPVVLSDGGLVGINVGGEHGFRWSCLSFALLHSTAHRPDLVSLRKVIDADVASFPKQNSSP